MVPAVIAGLAVWFQWATNNAAQEREDRRVELQLRTEADRARQNVMQLYLDGMKDLVLDRELANSNAYSHERQFARANTLMTLRQLDGNQKGLLLQFLHGMNLTIRASGSEPIHPILSLTGADLRFASLSGANLRAVDLSGTNLTNSRLHNADLSGADLSRADLSFADLSNTNLSGGDLSGAGLGFANLIGVDLRGANLSFANLRGVMLDDGDLSQPSVRYELRRDTGLSLADLSIDNPNPFRRSFADLSTVDLSMADLRGANLSNVHNLTVEKVCAAKTLYQITGLTPELMEQIKDSVLTF